MKNAQLGLEKCLPFISSQFQPAVTSPDFSAQAAPRLAVTISRQTGSGALAVGEKLAAYLEARAPRDLLPWRVIDRSLVRKVLEDHNLPQRFARFMPEDRVSEVADTIDELLGAHPPTSVLVRQTVETILRLAEQGHVILIGRGANIITGKLQHVFHVRLVGSMERRIRHIQEIRGVGHKSALAFIHNEDRGRRRYLKKHFGQDLDDPLLYHMVINTDRVPYERAAQIIGAAVLAGTHPRRDERVQRARVTRKAEAFG